MVRSPDPGKLKCQLSLRQHEDGKMLELAGTTGRPDQRPLAASGAGAVETAARVAGVSGGSEPDRRQAAYRMEKPGCSSNGSRKKRARVLWGSAIGKLQDKHPLAWYRIRNPRDGSEVRYTLLDRLWRQTKARTAEFPGSAKVIDGRPFLSFPDYITWPGRRSEGELKSGISQRLVLSQWNAWLESGGKGVEVLDGV